VIPFLAVFGILSFIGGVVLAGWFVHAQAPAAAGAALVAGLGQAGIYFALAQIMMNQHKLFQHFGIKTQGTSARRADPNAPDWAAESAEELEPGWKRAERKQPAKPAPPPPHLRGE